MKKRKMMKLGMFALTMLLAGTAFAQSSKLKSAVKDDFVTISGGRLDPYMIMKTEVPQWMYKEVMGDNPSKWKNNNNPAESMGVYNAVAFCNKLSLLMGLTPVYTVKGSTNPSQWGAMPRKDDEDWKKIKVNKDYGTLMLKFYKNGSPYQFESGNYAVSFDIVARGYHHGNKTPWEFTVR